jgi:hypothetical protein
MPYRVTIEFGDTTPDLTHRVRNFGEALYREFERTSGAAISLDEVDRATNQLQVDVRATRHLGTALELVNKLLRQHMLDEVAHVTRRRA